MKAFLSRWLTFPAAIGFLLFFVVFINSIQSKITEPDIWWHLRNAEQIVSTHSLPNVDHFSFTLAGSPWLDHEWLSELAYYAAFRALGLRGLFALFVALSAAIFMGLYYRCFLAGANPKTASVVLTLGILLGTVSFGPRPLLFGWACLTALLILLDRFDSNRDSALWPIPILFALWINLHGSWVLGMVLFVLFIACGSVRGEWGAVTSTGFDRAELRRLLATLFGSVVALMANPFGYKLIGYPFDLLFRQSANLAIIDEWQSVNFHELRGKLVMLLLLGLFTSMLLVRRWKLDEVLSAILAVCLSLMYWRMQFFGALILVPILALRLPLFPPYEPAKEKPVLNGTIICGVIVLLLLRMPSEAQLNEQIWRVYPASALTALRTEGGSDPVFHDYLWGGYMIWHGREVKTFIDGRADLFVYSGVLDDYVKIMQLQGSMKLLDRYGVRTAMLRPDAALTQLLDRDVCWRRAYDDKIAVIFRRSPDGPGCALRTAGQSEQIVSSRGAASQTSAAAKNE